VSFVENVSFAPLFGRMYEKTIFKINKIRENLKMKKIFLSLIVLVSVSLNMTFAQEIKQKIGHLNGGNLLALMPESALADSQLVKYRRDTLDVYADSVVTAFRGRAEMFMKEYQAGKIPPTDAEKIKGALEKEQAALERMGKQIDQLTEARRQMLLAPILAKVNEKLKEVALENKFDYILDEGSGVMLFTADSLDVMPMMKAKLGLK
jgi:outer membrane protein